MSGTSSPPRSSAPLRFAGVAVLVAVLAALGAGLTPGGGTAAPTEFELRAAMLTPAEIGANFGAWDRPEAFPHPKFPAVPDGITHFRTAYDRTTRNPTVVELLSIMLIDATNEEAARTALMEFADSRVAVRGLATAAPPAASQTAVAAIVTPAPGQVVATVPRARRTEQPSPTFAEGTSRFTVEGPGTTADVIFWRHRDVLAAVISEKITDPANGDVATALGYAQLQQNKLVSVLPLGASQQAPAQATSAPPSPTTAASLPSPAAAPTLVLQPRVIPALGAVLTDGEGFTLYTFDGDRPGESVCADGCAAVWPPLLVEPGGALRHDGVPGMVTRIQRADGSWQAAHNHHPLYRYTGDRQPGDTAGHGLGGVWRVVVLAPSP